MGIGAGVSVIFGGEGCFVGTVGVRKKGESKDIFGGVDEGER